MHKQVAISMKSIISFKFRSRILPVSTIELYSPYFCWLILNSAYIYDFFSFKKFMEP